MTHDTRRTPHARTPHARTAQAKPGQDKPVVHPGGIFPLVFSV